MGKLKTLAHRLNNKPELLEQMVDPSSWHGGQANSAQRGYGHKWRKHRARYLQQHPLCAYCDAKGKTTAATVVDHIVPHQGDNELFWDEDNHQPLCAPCHSSTKAKEEIEAGYRS